LFSLMGWFSPAEQALRSAVSHHADPLPVALVRATMARQQGDLRNARRELEAAERQFPDDSEVLKQLAAVAEGEGQIAEAKQRLEAAAKADADPEVWVALARLELRSTGAKGENPGEGGPVSPEAAARARADLQRALALRPELPAARLLMGRCLRLSGETTEARTTLERLHRERPAQEAVAFELSQLYRDLGLTDQLRPLMARYQQSMQQREQMRRAAVVVMAHPDSAAAHREMGRLCLQRGMIGRAILSLQRAREIDPRLPGVREALDTARRAAESPSPAAQSDPSDPSGEVPQG
jgi:tetratricopeptide (TPR) repeat protein